jgi:uncharacterized linocin/CFP29 family protein
MRMNDLRRELAPIPKAAWEQIEEESARVLKLYLAGRKLVDFRGPLGWQTASINLGRIIRIDQALEEHVEARLRSVQPLVELRVSFALDREELDDAARGAADIDLKPLIDAAERLARAEDRLIFRGFEPANIQGLCGGAGQRSLTIPQEIVELPQCVARALQQLRTVGVAGPFAIALAPVLYQQAQAMSLPGGSTLMQRLERIAEGPVVWSPVLEGGLVVSGRGGDFELVVGRDISLGYESHTANSIQLYLEESVTFRVLTPEAAVCLRTA